MMVEAWGRAATVAAAMAVVAWAALGGVATPADAADASCKQLFKLKSKESKTKTTITFVNRAKTYRGLLWLGFDGQPKDYGNVAPGQEKTIQTFLTHPWMVATGPGDCLHIVLPRKDAAGTRVIMAEKGVEVAAEGGEQDHGDPPMIVCEKAGMDYDGSACVPRKGKGKQAAGEEGGKARGCPPGTVAVPETDDCKAAPKGQEGSGKPVQGRSLGGILREKPRQDSARVTSLDEGQRITILRNTGVVWDNYPWFEINAGGTTGYKWGGILCADVPMPGVYEVCKEARSEGKPQAQPQSQVQAAGGAPPWCAGAKVPAEHAICGNPELGKLDGVLNVAYRRAVSDSAKKRAEIDHEHRRWRGRRDACGNDGGCIERRYLEQISFLESFFSN